MAGGINAIFCNIFFDFYRNPRLSLKLRLRLFVDE